MAKKYENIDNIMSTFSGERVKEFNNRLNGAEKKVSEIMKKLASLEQAQNAKKIETEEKEKEKQAKLAAEKQEKEAQDRAAKEKEAKEKEAKEKEAKALEDAQKAKAQDAEKAAKAAEPVKQEKTEPKPQEKSAPVKSAEGEKKTDKPVQNTDKPAQKPQTSGQNAKNGQNTQKPAQNQSGQNGNFFGQNKGQQGTRSQGQSQGQNRVQGGQNTYTNQGQGNRGTYRAPQGQTGNFGGQNKGQQGTRNQGQGNFADGKGTGNVGGQWPGQGGKPVGQGQKFVVPSQQMTGVKGGKDKKKGDKTYNEKEKKGVQNKRALIKQQGASVDDFDENKSGYRKLRTKKMAKAVQTGIKIEKAVVTTDEIALKTLSEKLGISAVDITKRLFKEGIMKTVNESIDYDTAAFIAADLGIELEYKPEKTAEEILSENQADTVEEIESLVPRAPVVTVMGHVDHGKTSLLDRIRSTNVTAGEAGGITQHIGAYSVNLNGKSITFIDTPGHEAFTAMRARGAQVTDIVILVVAADDGIMPQTIEAINHSKAANVTIVVAINKMDKAGANPDKIKQDLTGYGLVPEEWGGDTAVCEISCKTGQGIQELLETVLLVAEMKDLRANPAREARGTIIEARLDKGKGPLATVLVQNGTLRTGDNIVSGTITGKVRAMIDDKGKNVKEAGPSAAVTVLGFEGVPNAGDNISAVSQQLMKQLQEERKRRESDELQKVTSKASLDEFFGKLAEGNLKSLNLIIKGDVQGSVEAIKASVVKLSNEEVNVKVLHSAVGAISESDVMLADSSNAIILGFNVRPDTKAKALAERSKIDIRTYRVIYDLLDDIEAALKGMLTPKYKELFLGKCEVRQTFKITGVGNIAGCYVMEGKIVRGGKLRIYRDDVLVVEGNVQQLKRFKDDVKEVSFGYECGCAIEGFNDIKVGDIIECYMLEQIPVK